MSQLNSQSSQQPNKGPAPAKDESKLGLPKQVVFADAPKVPSFNAIKPPVPFYSTNNKKKVDSKQQGSNNKSTNMKITAGQKLVSTTKSKDVRVSSPRSSATMSELEKQILSDAEDAALRTQISTTQRKSNRSIANFLRIQFPNLQTIGGLKQLIPASHLFVSKSYEDDGMKITSPRIYEVISDTGDLVLQAVIKREKCFGLCMRCPHHFEAILSDVHGEEVLNIEADPGFYGRKSSLKVRGRLEKYGKIVQEGDCCTPDFSLQSTKGDQLLKIRPDSSVNCFNCCVPVEYAILHGEYTTNVGRLAHCWELACKPEDLPQYFKSQKEHHSKYITSTPDGKTFLHMYGACFPPDMPIQLKVLVLSTVFMVKIFRND